MCNLYPIQIDITLVRSKNTDEHIGSQKASCYFLFLPCMFAKCYLNAYLVFVSCSHYYQLYAFSEINLNEY